MSLIHLECENVDLGVCQGVFMLASTGQVVGPWSSKGVLFVGRAERGDGG